MARSGHADDSRKLSFNWRSTLGSESNSLWLGENSNLNMTPPIGTASTGAAPWRSPHAAVPSPLGKRRTGTTQQVALSHFTFLPFTPTPNMVGYIPPTMSLRKKKAKEMLQQVQDSWKSIDPQGTASVLQYDYREGKLSVWYWPVTPLPVEDSSDDSGDEEMEGSPVPPDALDRYRHTHHFKGPCCLCAFLDVSEFTEAKMGLLQTVGLNGSLVANLGQYVAMCAKERCGYFVVLENFYVHPGLQGKVYVKRDKPLATLDPFTFITDDTEETAKRAGLRQVRILQDEGGTALRGSRKLLRTEDPNYFVKAEERMEELVFRGLPSEEFWEVFIQCVDCKRVIPRHYYPYIHDCVIGTLKAERETSLSLIRRRLQQIDDYRTALNAEQVPVEFSESDMEHRYQGSTPGPSSNFRTATAAARRRSREDRELE
ncbi:hypothetical protein NMY22_g4685 [Coprinellus aureogranulatus]|nr:hypothetical protein NMY22_g4685 [Coprinellus aureogranulatus]